MKRILLLLFAWGVLGCDTQGEIIQGRTVSSIAPNSGAAGGNSPVIGGVYYDSAHGLSVSDSGPIGSVLILNNQLQPEWSDATDDGALPITGGTMLGNIALNNNYISHDGGTNGIFINDSGQVGLGTGSPTHKLHVIGDALKTVGGGSWQVASDARLKKDYGAYLKGLKEIKKLKIKKFSYLGQPDLGLQKSSELEQGVFAQDVLSIFPEAVAEHRGYYFVNYHPIQMASLRAIQELSQENQNLKNRLELLEQLVKELQESQSSD